MLFVYSQFSSFVEADFNILASEYKVDKYQFKAKPGILNVGYYLLKQLLFLSIHIWKYETVYIWFADYHSLLPVFFTKVLKKRSFLVNGGYDVARIKKINYGVFCSRIRGFFAIYSMKHCSANLPVSKYVDRKVKYIAPASTRYLIYNSMNLQTEKRNDIIKENLVLTVAIVNDQRAFFLKGLDTFIDTACLLPEYTFAIVGLNKSNKTQLLKEYPENLVVYDKIPHQELAVFYQRAKIYCQLSLTESFGVSVAEALFYNCYPIVTNEGALPEIVGEFGSIAKRDPVEIAAAIKHFIVNMPDAETSQASDYITNHFSPEIRKKNLIGLLNKK